MHAVLCAQFRSSKEVYKSNFQQYGQMERQRWEESEKRREEKRRSEKRKSQRKEDAGAQKHVFPMAPEG